MTSWLGSMLTQPDTRSSPPPEEGKGPKTYLFLKGTKLRECCIVAWNVPILTLFAFVPELLELLKAFTRNPSGHPRYVPVSQPRQANRVPLPVLPTPVLPAEFHVHISPHHIPVQLPVLAQPQVNQVAVWGVSANVATSLAISRASTIIGVSAGGSALTSAAREQALRADVESATAGRPPPPDMILATLLLGMA